MPNPKSIVLHASAAESASGAQLVPVDIDTFRSLLELTIEVSALTDAATITLFIETSLTGSGWTVLYQTTQTAPSSFLVFVPSAVRYARVRWTLSALASATFAVTGIAHQLYCEPADITAVSLPEAALTGISLSDRARQCLRSSGDADDYLSGGYNLPLVKISDSLRKHVANLAGFELLSRRGYDPDGTDKVVLVREQQALSWLKSIQAGSHRPIDIIDTTPLVTETDVWITAELDRGWRR